jgi:hypothetical protein
VAVVGTDVSEEMEAVSYPKHRFYIEQHGTKCWKISIIDIVVKTSQKTVFFGPTYYPSM